MCPICTSCEGHANYPDIPLDMTTAVSCLSAWLWVPSLFPARAAPAVFWVLTIPPITPQYLGRKCRDAARAMVTSVSSKVLPCGLSLLSGLC